MHYQLFPPVKSVKDLPGQWDLAMMGTPVYGSPEPLDFHTDLPGKLQPAYRQSETFFFQLGTVTPGAAPENSQGYTLCMEPQGIWIAAADAGGLRYGMDTLAQILAQAGGQGTCLEITDYPSLPNRGLMLDVSRGKVYTREYLMNLAKMLSRMRYNVLQLYMEHPFAFRKHPEIWEGSDPVAPEDILALQDCCRSLGIELQANLQCLGHCRRILTRKEHMHLSESDMFWSLCTTSEESIALLDDLFGEYLPLFDSEWVNICLDEPYDLGKGKSASSGKEPGELYVQFLKKVHDLAAKYGKKVMLFGDVILKHPEFLPQLPKDVRYIDWCYDPKPHYGTPAVFGKYHLDFWVSPGSGNWNTLFPRLDGCLTNVNNLLGEALEAHASGMLFTDWNDHGGYTQPGAGYYGYGYAAAVAWDGKPQDRAAVDGYLDRVLDSAGYSKVIRTLSQIYWLAPIWSKNRSECVMALFDEPIFGQAVCGPEPPKELKAYDLSLPEGVQPVLERHSQHPLRPYFSIPEDTCRQIQALAESARADAVNLPAGTVRDQLLYQTEAFLVMTRKLELSRKIRSRFAEKNLAIPELVLLEEDVRSLIQQYAHLQLDFIKVWVQIAKESEIYISLTYFAHILERLDYLRDWLSLQREALEAGKELSYDFSDYQTAGYGTLPTY